MKWQKYRKPNRNISTAERAEMQFMTAFDIWTTKKPNSLIRVAKAIRNLGKEADMDISFTRSIHIARRLSKGRLR